MAHQTEDDDDDSYNDDAAEARLGVPAPVPDGIEPLGDYLIRETKPPTYWEMVQMPDGQARELLAQLGHRARVALGVWLREAGEVYWEAYLRDPSAWSGVYDHGVLRGYFIRPWLLAHGHNDLRGTAHAHRQALDKRHSQDGVAHVQGLLAQILATSPGGRLALSNELMELIWYAVPHPLHHPGQYMASSWGPTGDEVWAIRADEVEDTLRRKREQGQARAASEGREFDQRRFDALSKYLLQQKHAFVIRPSVEELQGNLGFVPPWASTAVANCEMWASPSWVPTPMATWWARQCLGALTTWMGSTPSPARVHELFAKLEQIYADVHQAPVPWAVLQVRRRRGTDLNDSPALWCWSELFELLAGPDRIQNPWARELALRACLQAGPAGAPCPLGSFLPDESVWMARVHDLLDGTGATVRPRQPDDPEECYDLVLCLNGVRVEGPERPEKDPNKDHAPYWRPYCSLLVPRLDWDPLGADHGRMPRLSFISRHGSSEWCMAGPWYQHLLRTWNIPTARWRLQVNDVYRPQIVPDRGYRALRSAPSCGYVLC